MTARQKYKRLASLLAEKLVLSFGDVRDGVNYMQIKFYPS